MKKIEGPHHYDKRRGSGHGITYLEEKDALSHQVPLKGLEILKSEKNSLPEDVVDEVKHKLRQLQLPLYINSEKLVHSIQEETTEEFKKYENEKKRLKEIFEKKHVPEIRTLEDYLKHMGKEGLKPKAILFKFKAGMNLFLNWHYRLLGNIDAISKLEKEVLTFLEQINCPETEFFKNVRKEPALSSCENFKDLMNVLKEGKTDVLRGKHKSFFHGLYELGGALRITEIIYLNKLESMKEGLLMGADLSAIEGGRKLTKKELWELKRMHKK